MSAAGLNLNKKACSHVTELALASDVRRNQRRPESAGGDLFRPGPRKRVTTNVKLSMDTGSPWAVHFPRDLSFTSRSRRRDSRVDESQYLAGILLFDDISIHVAETVGRVPGEIKRSRDLRGGRWSWTLTFAQKRS